MFGEKTKDVVQRCSLKANCKTKNIFPSNGERKGNYFVSLTLRSIFVQVKRREGIRNYLVSLLHLVNLSRTSHTPDNDKNGKVSQRSAYFTIKKNGS